jgi:hypothetical protein
MRASRGFVSEIQTTLPRRSPSVRPSRSAESARRLTAFPRHCRFRQLRTARGPRLPVGESRLSRGSQPVPSPHFAPTRASSISQPSRTRPYRAGLRAPSQRQGGTVSGTPRLDCDLAGDCWEYFDEELHPARLPRVTVAPTPEQRVETSKALDASVLLSCGNLSPVEVGLQGTVGFSDAARADASEDEPFYLGSLGLSAQNAVPSILPQQLELACLDGTSDSVSLQDLDISLAQPTFGVQPRGEDSVLFPESSVQVWIQLTIDGEVYRVRRPNPAAVQIDHSNGEFKSAAFRLRSHVNCGDSSVALVDLWIAMDDGATLNSPPTGSVTTPSAVSCSTSVPLTESFTDPDGDLASVRWFVDDVPLSDSTTAISITESHTLRAVAEDARGAATTATKQISCN